MHSLNAEKPILIAIVVKSFEDGPNIVGGYRTTCATIKGESSEPAGCFELTPNPFDRETFENLQLMQKHGFTVVALPREWLNGYRSPNAWHGPIYSDEWKVKLLNGAMQRIKKQYEGTEGPMQRTTFDPEFARKVLEEINKHFPSPVQALDLKYAFENEPSDNELLIALAGLQRDELIEGKTLFSYTSANRQLLAMANIEITAKGRESIAGTRSDAGTIAHMIIQGDQYNNYGQAGAIGLHSVGTINIQQQWTEIQNQVDLNALTGDLEQLRKHLQQSASSSSDYYRLALLSEAEEHAKKHDGSKAMEVLSKLGKSALGVAKDIGAEIAAKVIAKSMGLES
jgi:hypothetical protein